MGHRIVPAYAGILLLALSASPSAHADTYKDIFTRAKWDQLCDDLKGRAVVSRAKLAEIMLANAGLKSKPLPARLTEEWRRRLAIGYAPSDERIFAVTDPSPFGEEPGDHAGDESKLKAERYTLTGFLSTGKALASSQGYAIPAEVMTAKDFLLGNRNISCPPKPAAKVAAADPEQAQLVTTLKDSVLIREKISDLGLSKAQMGKAHYAKVAYTKDLKNDKTEALVDGVLGLQVWNSDAPELNLGQTKVTVYTRVHSLNGSTDDGEHEVQPGVIWSTFYADTFLSAVMSGSGSVLFDTEADSRVTDFDVSISPSFNLSPEVQLFGGPLPPLFGVVAVSPTLEVLAGGTVIGDAGTNPVLQKKNAYVSYGAVTGVDVTFPYTAFLKDMRLWAKYATVNNTQDVRDARRFDTGVVLLPFSSDHWSINFDYHQGESIETLKDERYWFTSLGVRY